eukprot:Seg753.8 transcript_id=Seg753.8/GoldUCD/mRNA.D3Y31 product="ATP-dependent DNA helicase RecQ" protein_id=Seg753.8/GoldUCD/D3Y31
MAFRSSGLRIPVDLSSFDEGIKMVCYFFGVSKLMKEQLHALRSFLSGRDLYFSAPTGFGKSLIFQSLPVLYDTIQGNLIGTSFVLVLSPLVSLIEEQVAYINEKTGIAAVYLHNDQDEAILRDVENGGVYALVYSSPECMLSNNRWRNLLTSKSFRENCIAVAVDEAHCIAHWGTAEKDEKPFRAWYGNLKEMRSLVTRHTGFMAFTATATKSTKQKIFELLQLDLFSTAVVEKSPCKDNLRFVVKYVERDRSFVSIFGWLITDLMLKSIKTDRTLIYCQTRKQCSLIYRYLSVELAAASWKHEGKRLIEMFDAGTPETVKKHVIAELSDGHSCLRVVICTIAFGMGINCVDFTRVFNFGPPRNMEEYIQMCGRAKAQRRREHSHIII